MKWIDLGKSDFKDLVGLADSASMSHIRDTVAFVDRITEIADKVEWCIEIFDIDKVIVRSFCPICGENKVDGHHPTCLYSDEYKPDDQN